MKSKRQLFKDLAELTGDETYITRGLNHPGIGNETYGRKSCVYVEVPNTGGRAEMGVNRRIAEGFLTRRGHKVNTEYWTESCITEVQVTYFKGHKWDE